MTKSDKEFVRESVSDLLRHYSRGTLLYVEAVKEILKRYDDGVLLRPEAEYALRLLAQTRGPRG